MLSATQEAETMNHSREARGFVILNPSAGDGSPDKIRSALESALGQGSYDVHETSEGEDLQAIVQTAVQQNNYAWVAAAGGDGTVSLVADGLVDSEVPLAIIPGGTSNVLARTLEIPQDIDKACALIAEAPRVRRIDGMQLGDQYFFLRLGVGLESMAMKQTSSAQKSRWGTAAYLWTAVKQFPNWRPHHFRLTVDGKTHQIRASELICANAGKFGVGELKWSERIEPDDGRIDIAVVKARSVLEYLQVAAALLFKGQHKSKQMEFFSAKKEIRVEANQQLPIHGDGEALDVQLPVTAVIKPATLGVIVPTA